MCVCVLVEQNLNNIYLGDSEVWIYTRQNTMSELSVALITRVSTQRRSHSRARIVETVILE